ncbi:MAG: hypothetical protein ACREYE_09280, partial [Gammaproteobacteria bacterium]
MDINILFIISSHDPIVPLPGNGEDFLSSVFINISTGDPGAGVPETASSAEFVGTDLRRIYASDSLLGIKLRSIGPKFWVSKNLLG